MLNETFTECYLPELIFSQVTTATVSKTLAGSLWLRESTTNYEDISGHKKVKDVILDVSESS